MSEEIAEVLRQQKEIIDLLERLEKRLSTSTTKETYTVEEVAERLGRTPWTVRQYCNKGQVPGAKKIHGRGRQGEWRIPHDGLVRLQSEGPLPVSRTAS